MSALGGGGGGGGGGERRYSVPSNPLLVHDPRGMHSEDLHAWSIYRQNLNSDFTDSALGSTDKSPLPYGNFQLRDTTVQSILAHPRYGPKSALGSNMYTYLKFGLPRVFPPNHNGSQRSGTPRPKTSIGSAVKPVPRVQRSSRGVRETSSGYDSSDNETSMNYKNSRKYRSDPDFRMQNLHPSYQHPGIPLVAMHAAGIRGEPHWNGARHKSISEANLLGIEARGHARAHPHSQHRRGSVAELSPDTDHHSYLMSASHLGSRISKAGSHMSLAHSRKQSTLRPGDYVDSHIPSLASYIYPNYYVNNLEITSPENKSTLLVSGLSFEVRSGEVLGVLATSHHEATGLLDVLAGVKKKLSGDIVLNGQPVSARTLRRVVGYVRAERVSELCPHMSVEHTLALHAALRTERARSKRHHASEDTINLLMEELGLEQVRLTSVGRLTRSELRRLSVACQLLLDTAILLLDQPTKEMDIFDTFFLVEYLRNWAATGRAVVISLHPPTYEIFAMLTKVVLTSAGRTMFSGYRRDMLPYFASIDYPCPAFKNPSDYYLDLVTLDDLSAAAMLESSGRIEALAGVFAATRARDPPPDPPPPVPLPAPTHSPNIVFQAYTLLKRTVVYTQMHSIMSLITRLTLAAVLSLITGALYWDVPLTDPKLKQNDRVGYHYTVMCVCVWPMLLLTVSDITTSRRYAERDIQHGLYSRTLYILVSQTIRVYSSSLVWLAYLIPSYAMSGLYAQSYNDLNGFYYYIGYMLMYLLGAEMLVCAATYAVPRGKTAAMLSALLLLVTYLVCGVLLHASDMPEWATYVEYASPARYTTPELLRRELSERALKTTINPDLTCTNKQRPYQDIIVQSPCPLPNGTHVLATYEYLRAGRPWERTEESFLVALAMFYGVFALVAIVAFVLDCTSYTRSREKRRRRGHKSPPNAP